MKILIDTNRYSDFAKGDEAVVELFTTADRIYVPFVVIAALDCRPGCPAFPSALFA